MPYGSRFSGFSAHPKIEGTHAFLSASNYHWLEDSEEKLLERLTSSQAAKLGSELHAWAEQAILLGRRQPERDDPNHDMLCAYINDALDFGMVPEQMLFHSMYAYGTADTIRFDEYDDEAVLAGFLRIHDYKSGKSKASVKQLYIYAGFFCLEYGYRPFEIEGELRIYQGDEVQIYELDREVLSRVYDKIRMSNLVVERRLGGQF